ncbi:MAG: DUF1036 domain-containing protein [Scytonema hyalinum WJT4-NPBG1]|jgi:uncharacterized membrane protein|nr:DUF1036 domain-containing protein [Scytonema hyalinum WJT4-NPBG1]
MPSIVNSSLSTGKQHTLNSKLMEVNNMKISLAVLSGVLLSSASFVFSTPARSDVILCNQARTKYLAAISWTAPDNRIRSSGWYQIPPGQCRPAGFRGDTSNSTFAVYGENTGGGFHTGDIPRCVIQFPTQADWTLDAADDASRCTGRGRVMTKFRLFRNVSLEQDQTYVLSD